MQGLISVATAFGKVLVLQGLLALSPVDFSFELWKDNSREGKDMPNAPLPDQVQLAQRGMLGQYARNLLWVIPYGN